MGQNRGYEEISRRSPLRSTVETATRHDRIAALQCALESYDQLLKMSEEYPTYFYVGTYFSRYFFAGSKHTLDDVISELWDSL